MNKKWKYTLTAALFGIAALYVAFKYIENNYYNNLASKFYHNKCENEFSNFRYNRDLLNNISKNIKLNPNISYRFIDINQRNTLELYGGNRIFIVEYDILDDEGRKLMMTDIEYVENIFFSGPFSTGKITHSCFTDKQSIYRKLIWGY